jgi:Xaa-Pro aminopeptidase
MADYNQKLRDAEKVIQNINEHIEKEEREEDKLIIKRNSLQNNIRTLEAELKDLTVDLEKIKRIKEKYEIEIRTEENKIRDARRMLEK